MTACDFVRKLQSETYLGRIQQFVESNPHLAPDACVDLLHEGILASHLPLALNWGHARPSHAVQRVRGLGQSRLVE